MQEVKIGLHISVGHGVQRRLAEEGQDLGLVGLHIGRIGRALHRRRSIVGLNEVQHPVGEGNVYVDPSRRFQPARRARHHPIGFLLPLSPDLFRPFQELLVFFGNLFLGLAGEGHPPVLVVLIGLILLENQVSVLAEIEGAALKDFCVFGQRRVAFTFCHW